MEQHSEQFSPDFYVFHLFNCKWFPRLLGISLPLLTQTWLAIDKMLKHKVYNGSSKTAGEFL